ADRNSTGTGERPKMQKQAKRKGAGGDEAEHKSEL
ncbi:hypothetical protein GWI33_009013, partial [Rhynchophorus ferrugineus]